MSLESNGLVKTEQTGKEKTAIIVIAHVILALSLSTHILIHDVNVSLNCNEQNDSHVSSTTEYITSAIKPTRYLVFFSRIFVKL